MSDYYSYNAAGDHHKSMANPLQVQCQSGEGFGASEIPD